MVGAFIMQGSEEMYRFDIREISKEDTLKMIQKYHYSNTLTKINKYFLGFFLEEELVGVVTLGWGTRPRLMMSIFVIFNRLLIRMILTMKWSK